MSSILLKICYAVSAGIFCVWVLSFVPAEGRPIGDFVPAQAGIFLQIHDGDELFRVLLRENSVAQDLFNDPDIKELFGAFLNKGDEALEKLRKLPPAARWLIPATREGLFPFAGRECAVALCAAPEGTHTQPFVVFTRVSGAQGQLARIAARFAKLPKNLKIFDLGGDLLALGVNGAAPVLNASQKKLYNAAVASPIATSAPVALGRLAVYPKNLISPQTHPPKDNGSGVSGTPLEGVAAEYLSQSADIADMLNLKQAPDEIQLEFFAAPAARGGTMHGIITGGVPAAPVSLLGRDTDNSKSATEDNLPFAEGVLPFNPKACFINYLHNAMRSRQSKQRWLGCFESMAAQDISLDRDLWPALGHAVHFTFQDAPENLTMGVYGVLNGSVTFDGARPHARLAMDELAQGGWEVFDGRADAATRSQYVRRTRTANADRYVLVTKQTMAPMWTVSKHEISIVSDAGPFALLDQPLEGSGPPPILQNANGAGPASFFIHMDGPRMANKAEAWATLYYDSLEKDMGTGNFLNVYPDAALRIRVAQKLSRFLGKLEINVVPAADGNSASIQGSWIKGSMIENPAPKTDDVAPPP